MFSCRRAPIQPLVTHTAAQFRLQQPTRQERFQVFRFTSRISLTSKGKSRQRDRLFCLGSPPRRQIALLWRASGPPAR